MAYVYTRGAPGDALNFATPLHHDTYPAIDPTKSNLSGKAVFISGASKGIGRASALSYAKAGASHIAIAARSSLSSLETAIADAATAAGRPAPQVLSIKLDVQSLESVQSAARATEKAFGRLDVLINNAGYLENFKPVADSDPEDYWYTWEINYRGVYWVSRAFLPLLLKTESGLMTILNLSSVGALHTRPGASAYQTSKFAIMRFSEFLCVEYAEKGLLAYSVHPGGVPTELALNMPKEVHGILIDTPEMGADGMVFLTQEKRTWLAGRYISLNWDLPKLLSMEDEIVKGDKLKLRLAV